MGGDRIRKEFENSEDFEEFIDETTSLQERYDFKFCDLLSVNDVWFWRSVSRRHYRDELSRHAMAEGG